MIVLPDAKNHMIVSSFVWTKQRNVTKGRTDGQTDKQKWSGYYADTL